MTFRRLVLVTHRWVGLTSMAFLALLGATGSLMLLPRKPRLVGQLHTAFALGRSGELAAAIVTILGTLMVLGGLVLWWRRRRLSVRLRGGWRVALSDLHHVVGSASSLFLIVLCLSATVMWRTRVPPRPRPAADGTRQPEPASLAARRRLHQVVRRVHAAEGMSRPVKLFYFAGSASFVLLGASGLTMWIRSRRSPATDPT